ncbi:MAG: hypothetical protein V3T05_00905 [Myxococcota bacterium]
MAPWPHILTLCLLAGLTSCTAKTTPVNGLPCDDGACLDGFVCDPSTNLCVRELPGDGNGDTNSDGNCAACTTFYRDDDDDGAGQDGDTQCLCEAADPYDATVGGDCNDGNAACTGDCSSCPPTSLTLTLLTPVPINPTDAIDFELDLGGYIADASADITCTATPLTIFGPVSFDGRPSLGSVNFNAGQWRWLTEPTAPYDKAACTGAADFVVLRASRNNANLRLDPELDAGGFEQLQVTFRAAVADGYVTGDTLLVQSCCGNGCGWADILTVAPVDIGDTNACSSQQTALPDSDCAVLALRWFWEQHSVEVGIDDISIAAAHIVPAVVASTPGKYTTSITARAVGSFDVACTWSNAAIGPDLSDTATVTVE